MRGGENNLPSVPHGDTRLYKQVTVTLHRNTPPPKFMMSLASGLSSLPPSLPSLRDESWHLGCPRSKSCWPENEGRQAGRQAGRGGQLQAHSDSNTLHTHRNNQINHGTVSARMQVFLQAVASTACMWWPVLHAYGSWYCTMGVWLDPRPSLTPPPTHQSIQLVQHSQ